MQWQTQKMICFVNIGVKTICSSECGKSLSPNGVVSVPYKIYRTVVLPASNTNLGILCMYVIHQSRKSANRPEPLFHQALISHILEIPPKNILHSSIAKAKMKGLSNNSLFKRVRVSINKFISKRT